MGFRMRARRAHRPDTGDCLDLKRGARLAYERRPTKWAGWIWCTNDEGVSAWVPESRVTIDGDTCIILRDYVSREIVLDAGDEVVSDHTESGWAWVRTADGEEGWAPLDCLERVIQQGANMGNEECDYGR